MKKDRSFHLLDMLRCLQLGKSELQIYDALTKCPMTIKDLKKATKLSERMLRASIDELIKKDFVKKEVLDDKRLKYIYQANQPKNVLEFIKIKISEMEERRLRSRDEILKGLEYGRKKR